MSLCRRSLAVLLGLLLAGIAVWLLDFWPDLLAMGRQLTWTSLGLLVAMYLLAHGLRMLRLGLLALDERERMAPLMAAHGLTGFVSGLIPFKGGEVLRLVSFFVVMPRPAKALAVWLAERFCDALVLSLLIGGLYFLRVPLTPVLHGVLMFFVVSCVLALLALLAVSKLLVFLNRHLVLVSHSQRGLWILRLSAVARTLELEIYRSVEARLMGLLLLTVLIWGLEIGALLLLLSQVSGVPVSAGVALATSMTGSLQGVQVAVPGFGVYQSCALALMAVATALAVAYGCCHGKVNTACRIGGKG